MFNKNDFQNAFSSIHASEDTLLEVLSMTNERKHSNRWIRITIAAAIIACLLTTTALAAPIIYERVIGNGEVNATVTSSWYAETPSDPNGNSVTGTNYQIKLDVAMHENPPTEIETYYMPQLPAQYSQQFGYAYAGLNHDQLDTILCYWGASEETASIHFSQSSAHAYEMDGMGFNLFLKDGHEPLLDPVKLGNVDGYLIEAPDDPYDGVKYFCWSDGDYVFYLRFPITFTEEQMSDIIATVQPVEEIRPYLITMTDEEFIKVFADRP